MNRIVFAAVALLVLVGVSGCGNRDSRPVYRVESYSGGQKIGEWQATSRPWGNSSRTWFTDATTDRTVEVSGDFTITELP